MGVFRFGLFQRTRYVVSICLVVTLAFFGLMSAARAQKPTNDQTAQATMEVFVAIATGLGAPIPKEAVPVMQGMVSCALAGTAVGECAKNIAISTALSEVSKTGALNSPEAKAIADAASCLTSGQSAQICLLNTVVSQLPPEAQPLAGCIGNGGNIADCAQKAALTVANQQLGNNLPPEAKSTLDCVIAGAKLATCAQTLVRSQVDQALKAAGVTDGPVKTAVDGMVGCLANGGNAADCGKNVVINNIPAGPARDLATCLNKAGATAQGCVATTASQNIQDPTASAVVGCMGKSSGDAVQQCIAANAKQALGDAASQAAQQALVTAADTIEKLQLDLMKPQTPPKFPEQPAVLQNILSVAHGIQDGDWPSVVLGVGAQGAEIAGKIILSIFLTPALAGVLSPVVDSMIQNDVNAFTNGVNDLKNGDAVGVAEDIFKWYETQYIQAPCALMPDGSFRNSVCNGLATAINWVASEGGQLAKDILGIGKDILKDLGLWNTVDDVATTAWNDLTSVAKTIGHFLGIGHDETKYVCIGFPPPTDYFANSVVNACLSAATSNAAASTPAKMSSSAKAAVTNQCAKFYEICPNNNPKTVEANCGKMSDALDQMAGNAATGIRQAANRYAQTAVATFAAKKYAEYKKSGHPEDICSTGFWSSNLGEFAQACASAVGAPLTMPADTCGSFRPTYGNAVVQACTTTLENSPYLTNAVAGPNGSFCKKWEQDATNNGNCQFTDPVPIPGTGGIVIPMKLQCHYIKPKWLPGLLPSIPLQLPRPPHLVSFPGAGKPFDPRSIILSLPGVRFPTTVLLPNTTPSGSTIKPLPGKRGTPLANLPGGGLRFPPDVRHGPSLPPKLPDGGPSGFRPKLPEGGGSAMDNAAAAATGGGFANVGGNAGGPSITPRGPGGGLVFGGPKAAPLPLPKNQKPPGGGTIHADVPPGGVGGWNGTQGGGTGKGGTVPPAGNGKGGTVPPGGTGGIGLVNGASGNSPVGSGSRVRPGGGMADRPGNVKLTPKAAASPAGPDGLIDYGGCSSCGGGKFVQPK